MRRHRHTIVIALLFLFGAAAGLREASQPVDARPPQQAAAFEGQILDIRLDLEALADRVFGGGSRPPDWNGPSELGAANALANLWFDNELLANDVYGEGSRPENWIGATTTLPDLVLRNVRHDLELSADEVIGDDIRPSSWVGGEPSAVCSRTVQNTVYLLDLYYGVQPTVGEGVVDYCRSLAAQLESELVATAFDESRDAENIPGTILAIRGDLERIADETFGLDTRPAGWIRNTDINSGTLAPDILNDLELLADAVVAPGRRPPGWIGALTSSQIVNARNLRFDLELVTDAALSAGVRPRGWQGIDPIIRCEPAVQNLVLLAETALEFSASPETIGSENYCQRVAFAANNLAENPPVTPDEVVDRENERFLASSENAFSYLDVAATQYMGPMPLGTEFRAWYRNFNESTMMFVSGENFAVYVDLRWTTLEPEVFQSLPTLEGVRPLTFCDANWCSGPRSTPTPTGSGALFEVITAATPQAAIAPEQIAADGDRTQVSWNHIRVNYVAQQPETNSAQVTLEICREVAQIACEPVVRVVNNSTGQVLPVLQQFNGLNVYELPYGYSTNLIIEGTTLFSTDIWLNDPALAGT
jgi:hypothetical protein